MSVITTPENTRAPQHNPGLSVSALHKSLGGRTIIDNLSLDVKSGELVSLLGPSGCGKTTTLRMIAGFITPDRGSIAMGGAEVSALGPNKRPSAMVFQNYALWPHMSVAKNVAYPLKYRQLSRAEINHKVDHILELVNLLHHRNSRPAHISGGEAQRVALARALVQEPSVLLLDEPLSNLDAKLRVQVREDIRELQQRLGITTVIVTHDQEEALSISDRVAVMNAGRIEQFSTPEALYNQPETEFVATFIGALNRFPGAFDGTRIVPGEDVVGIRPEHVLFHSAPRHNALPATVERLIPFGHFTELRLRRADGLFSAYVTGKPPAVGETGYASLESALIYRNGLLVKDGGQ